jgi:hypothetical protein
MVKESLRVQGAATHPGTTANVANPIHAIAPSPRFLCAAVTNGNPLC